MNERYEWEASGLNQFFAEAEMEDEVGRRRRAAPKRARAARSASFRNPYAGRKISGSAFVKPGFIQPSLIRPFIHPWFPKKPRKPKFPIPFPIPGILDPSPWRDPNRPPEPPRPPDQPSPPPPSSLSPPPAGSTSPPASEPAPFDEPPDMTADEPSTPAEPPDEGPNDPSGSGDEDTPTEEFFELFSEYEYPSHELGGHRCCRRAGSCTCGQGPQPAPSGMLSEFFLEFEQPDASVLGLEALDTEFEAARYSEPEWEYEQAPRLGCPTFAPTAVENPGGGRIKDKRIPPVSELVTIPGAFGAKVPIHRLAANAHTALVCAARADGIKTPLLLPTGRRSGFRDPKQQMEAWKRAVAKYKSEKEANKWVARPGSSAHQTGRAIDFYMGSSNSSGNVAKLSRTRAYSWMVANARRFGFYPYQAEPWHWEYNPPVSSATNSESHEFSTPYAQGGRFTGRYQHGQGIGHRRRHPRS